MGFCEEGFEIRPMYVPKTEIGNSNHLVFTVVIHVLPSETICREYDLVAVNYTGTVVGEFY